MLELQYINVFSMIYMDMVYFAYAIINWGKLLKYYLFIVIICSYTNVFVIVIVSFTSIYAPL